MVILRFFIVVLAAGLLINTCTKDKATSSNPAPTGCTGSQEVWNVSDSLRGTLTFAIDANCNMTASGTLKTTDGDSIIFSNVPISLNAQLFSLNAIGQSFLVQTGACTLRVTGAALEGAASGTFTLSFSTGSGNRVGTFTAVRASGNGITASAALLSAGAFSQGNAGTTPPLEYRLTDTTIILSITYADTYVYCSGDSLVRQVSSGTFEMPVQYQLTDNTLLWIMPSSLNTATVNQYYHFTRKGNGSGIQGGWTCDRAYYEVVSGVLDSAEKARLDQWAASAGTLQLKFTDTQIIETGYVPSDNGITSPADDFINSWNRNNYNITLTKISSNCIMLEGNTTGEVMVIVFYNDRTVYYSSDYTHQTHTYYQNPTECPNDYSPQWYYDFQNHNLAAKAAAKAVDREPLRKPHRIPFLLKGF